MIIAAAEGARAALAITASRRPFVSGTLAGGRVVKPPGNWNEFGDEGFGKSIKRFDRGNAMPDDPTGPAIDDDAIEVHLFLCLDNGHYAVTTDLAGTNLPTASCLSGWKHINTIALGAREALPFPASPEPAIRAIRENGFYVFDSALPHGTSQ